MHAHTAAGPGFELTIQSDLGRACAGDRTALERVLRRYRPQIERMCRHMISSSADQIDDVIQDTYLAIVRNIASYRGEASFLTWAYTIARTSRGRHLRRVKLAMRRSEILAMLADRTEGVGKHPRSPDQAVADRELGDLMQTALSTLSDTDRRVLLMRDLEGWTANEVSAQTGLTVPAVKTRLHRARVAMRSRLSPATCAA